MFRVKQEEAYSDLKDIKAGVPQDSVLGPVLYVLFTSDIPNLKEAKLATFAADTALLTKGQDEVISTRLLHPSNTIYEWTQKLKIKLNEAKSAQNFTSKRLNNPPSLVINGTVVPYENKAKYLDMTLDTKLRWKEHAKRKKRYLA